MGKKHIQKLIAAQSRSGRPATKTSFWGGLEQYSYGRVREARVPWVWAGTAMALLVIVSSLASGYASSPTLYSTGSELIREVALRGDYPLADRLYREYYESRIMNNVLGAEIELEELVYPERKLWHEIERQEALLAKYPGHRDILLTLALLYQQSGDNEKAWEYWEEARVLDPNGEQVKEIREILDTGFLIKQQK